MSEQEYTRGRLAKAAGCNLETVRYYEKEGLLQKPRRSQKGYRLYNNVDVRRLKFIRRCRELGFSLAEIRELLSLVDKHNYTCADISDITKKHAEEVKSKISDLNKILKTLQEMAGKCRAGNSPDCPILEALFE
ncbi:MAG: MerR family transcriptional regulator [Alphaproteobacteria bacterium]|nr:MerR family transcriptional regulator [Alphaproteobacteria bacterium]